MKIGIYNPYLNILGGGEKYTFDLADFFLKRDCEADFFWDDLLIKNKLKEQYNLELERIKIIPNIFKKRRNFIEKLTILKKYDYFFYNTDGSLFYPDAKKNILIIQSPAHVPDKTFFNQLKMKFWDLVLCNSFYVKKTIKENWFKNISVLYPSAETSQFKPLEKENLIISVGRFTQALHAKKQEILVEAFKRFSQKLPKVKLILAGGLMRDEEPYFRLLKEKSRGYNIEIIKDMSFDKLKIAYGKAKIYWHAAGFGADLEKNPEKAEHFGISTVEAMAAGCIPIVYKAGGQLEIVDEDKNGFFWETEEELILKTEKVIKNYDNYGNLINNAILRSRDFSKAAFEENLKKILCL